MLALPDNADPDDPRLGIAFQALAHGLIKAGAKAKIVERYTGLSHRRVRALYRALTGSNPPAGPTLQGGVRYFQPTSKRAPRPSRVQCAIFLSCIDGVHDLSATPLQRGWQLLTAYRAYVPLAEDVTAHSPRNMLDINQAYALLVHYDTRGPGAIPLERLQCVKCCLCYLGSPTNTQQECPICSMEANRERLQDQLKRVSSGIDNP